MATESNANTNGAPRLTVEGLRAASLLLDRYNLAHLAGLQFQNARDLYSVFGYKKKLDNNDYLAKYIRQDIASRVIDAPPTATWSNPPRLVDYAGAAEWENLTRKHLIWDALNRVDRLARLYPYSILLIGTDDSTQLNRPVNPNRVKNLLYIRAIGARMISEMTLNNDPTSPRFGQPDMYKLEFDDPGEKKITKDGVSTKTLNTIEVHHSRVIHVVENPLEDSVVGTPVIERVYNLLDDLLKVAGGTAETYWLTSNRGMQANIDKEMTIDPADAKALSDEIEEYQHQLRRFIRTRGVELKVLESMTPNPEQTFNMIVALISGTTGIPKRILLGSEAGELASAQDRANWAERIEERRELYAEPRLLRPTIDFMQTVGLLPEGEYTVKWPSAFRVSPLERAQTMAQTARAVGNLSRQTGNNTPMQVTTREEARAIVGLEGDIPEDELFTQPGDGTEGEIPDGTMGGDEGEEGTDTDEPTVPDETEED